jgi:ATP-dependent exoDNAse (exonuclease V) alpha subunit
VAIEFARARYISRSTGGNAVRSAAYNGRATLDAERTGERFSFRHRDAPAHHALLLPAGADERFAEPGLLWNGAERAERRKDAQVAREIVLALPADRELSTEDRIALASSFAERHFVAKGLAVQLDVHAPHLEPGQTTLDPENERANWHAHLLISTRRLDREGFCDKKARDLDPEVRMAGGRARVADGLAWGQLWREHQERYFREHGLQTRVDRLAPFPEPHIGPVRMRLPDSDLVARGEAIRQANREAARDPDKVLTALTRNNATFTDRELTQFLAKQLGHDQPIREPGQEPAKDKKQARGQEEERERELASIKRAVRKHPDLVPLYDRDSGEASGRFTTKTVRTQERAAMREAHLLGRDERGGGVSDRSAQGALVARSLRPDQAAAFEHAIGPGHLKLIEGRAGTGKSFTLAAIRDAHARDGKRVVGLAPTNTIAQDLARDGFEDARTVHAALFARNNGRTVWDRKTVLVLDEAAMLDARITGELLTAARESGAKLILAGDDRQLASIERGGLFAELRERHGAVEITEVTRQTVDWQREASRDLAEGRFAAAVGAYDRAGAITWTPDQPGAHRALVDAWKRDAEAHPDSSRFVFAYTNRDVDTLNRELRQVRRDRGELAGHDIDFDTRHGRAAFAVGDRIQFTDTDKRLGLFNGRVATITRLDPAGEIVAKLDAPGRDGPEVRWDAEKFEGFRHGYAGTIYKGQGKTLDRTYLYHTEHWRASASYVALTRQRDHAQIFVARETARDVSELSRQMGRGEVRAASIAWPTREELAAERTRDAAKERISARIREAFSFDQQPDAALQAERAAHVPAGRDAARRASPEPDLDQPPEQPPMRRAKPREDEREPGCNLATPRLVAGAGHRSATPAAAQAAKEDARSRARTGPILARRISAGRILAGLARSERARPRLSGARPDGRQHCRSCRARPGGAAQPAGARRTVAEHLPRSGGGGARRARCAGPAPGPRQGG